jgi:uncharacterized protein
MAQRSEYPAGTFCWVDLATTDQEMAKSFYGDLLGWSYLDVPTDMGNTYSLATVDAQQVTAIYPLPPGQQNPSPHWTSYVSVVNADDAANRAADLGGSVIMAPSDVMTAGRMAVIRDPTGAVFSMWEARDHFGAALVNQHGALCWNELMTSDVSAATAFYTALFDWSAEPFGDSYSIFMNGERPAGGMIAIDEQEMDSVPPNWSVYFAVDDCDAVEQQAVSLGGTVRMPATDFPEVGRGCVLDDAQGGTFAVIRLFNAPD